MRTLIVSVVLFLLLGIGVSSCSFLGSKGEEVFLVAAGELGPDPFSTTSFSISTSGFSATGGGSVGVSGGGISVSGGGATGSVGVSGGGVSVSGGGATGGGVNVSGGGAAGGSVGVSGGGATGSVGVSGGGAAGGSVGVSGGGATGSVGVSGGGVSVSGGGAAGGGSVGVSGGDVVSVTGGGAAGGDVVSVTGGGAAGGGVSGGGIVRTGNQPGLYGGSRDRSSCDVAQLVSFLDENADKAGAWIGALTADSSVRLPDGGALTTTSIGNYVSTLTPLVLTQDTRVTNHGFRNGIANGFQSVLQGGTAVLVDERGVPRVKCECGNPLLPPTGTETTANYRGTQWAGFNHETITVVEPAPEPIFVFVVTEVETGGLINRPIATSGQFDTVNLTGFPPTVSTVTRTHWMMYPGGSVINLDVPMSPEDPVEAVFTYARIPAQNDPGWIPTPNPDIVGYITPSNISVCRHALDYDYYQMLIDVPHGTALDRFEIEMRQVDDRSRLTIYNDANPYGNIVSGSYLGYAGSANLNLGGYLTAGRNRLVITMVDWCQGNKGLGFSQVKFNGQPIPTAAGARLTLPVRSVELVRGQQYWSSSGTHYMVFREDGNLVTYTANGGYVWSLQDLGVGWQGNTRCIIHGDGNLVTYAGETATWASGTHGNTGAHLTLTSSGELQIVHGNHTLWGSASAHGGRLTLPLAGGTELVRGQMYWSTSGTHFLLFREDGDLAVYEAFRHEDGQDDGIRIWSIQHLSTEWRNNTRCVMQEDGNLVTYAGETVTWASGTHGNAGAQLTFTSSGELQIVHGGRTLWSSASTSAGETMVIDGTQVRTGQIQVTLEWDSPADLDLFVTDPNGDRVWYSNRSVASGGQLDVDSRANCQDTPSRVENIFWANNAPIGTYRVDVSHYSGCGDQGAVSYTATLRRDGQVIQVWRGAVEPATRDTYTFEEQHASQSASGETMVIDGTEVRTGQIQVTLEWDSPADLDLFVTDPNGDRVGYNNTSVPSGGELDVDSRANCTETPSTVENIIWADRAPSGTYRVDVNHFAACGDPGAVSYTATLRRAGQVIQTWRGTVGSGGNDTYTFNE